MNPFAVLGAVKQFEDAHPKAAAFVRNELLTGLPEGTILEMTVTKPGGTSATTNIKLTQQDLDALNTLKNLKDQK